LRQTLESDPFYEPEGNFVLREGEQIVGWCLCKANLRVGPELGRFQNRGGIGALCVHPHYQRSGLGTQLCDAAEEYLRHNGSPLTTLYFPHHLLPGIPSECEPAIAFFRARGYSAFTPCFDMHRNLNEYSIPDKARLAIQHNPSVELRRARDDERDQVLSFVEREFPGGWTYSTRRHFAQGAPASDFVVAVENELVIGFCHTADWRSTWLLPNIYWGALLGERYGGLGPIGIAREHRKRGLGLALCAVAVQELKEAGVEQMCIDWTTLESFYAQLGFEVWKRYFQGEKM
jgi:GNAT superfamily N-acetyltransferase